MPPKGKKKQKVVGESSRQAVERPIIDQLDSRYYGIEFDSEIHQARWRKLIIRNVSVTRFHDHELTQKMGIDADVNKLVARVGWTKFLSRQWTYKVITLEFLSTLEIEMTSKRSSTPARINFRLQNTPHTLTVDELNRIYDLPSTGDFTQPSDYHDPTFWRNLTEVPGLVEIMLDEPNRRKASSIRNPIFRYLQRLMALSLYARPVGGVCRKDEIFLLWCMLAERRVDVGAQLISQFERTVTSQKGEIVIGGLITPIAEAVRVNMDEMVPVDGDRRLSWEDLEHMKIVRRVRRRDFEGNVVTVIEVMQNKGGYLILPNTPLTTVDGLHDRQNWSLYTEAHIAQSLNPDEGEVQEPQHAYHPISEEQEQQEQQEHQEHQEYGEQSESMPEERTMHAERMERRRRRGRPRADEPPQWFQAFETRVGERIDSRFDSMIENFSNRFQVHEDRIDTRIDTMMETFSNRFQIQDDRYAAILTQQQQMYQEHLAQMARINRDYPPPPPQQ